MDVIKFLKKHNVYKKALHYTRKTYGFEGEQRAKNYYKYYGDSPTLIGFFEFHKTDEGQDYWLGMNNKFKQLINKNRQ